MPKEISARLPVYRLAIKAEVREPISGVEASVRDALAAGFSEPEEVAAMIGDELATVDPIVNRFRKLSRAERKESVKGDLSTETLETVIGGLYFDGLTRGFTNPENVQPAGAEHIWGAYRVPRATPPSASELRPAKINQWRGGGDYRVERTLLVEVERVLMLKDVRVRLETSRPRKRGPGLVVSVNGDESNEHAAALRPLMGTGTDWAEGLGHDAEEQAADKLFKRFRSTCSLDELGEVEPARAAEEDALAMVIETVGRARKRAIVACPWIPRAPSAAVTDALRQAVAHGAKASVATPDRGLPSGFSLPLGVQHRSAPAVKNLVRSCPFVLVDQQQALICNFNPLNLGPLQRDPGLISFVPAVAVRLEAPGLCSLLAVRYDLGGPDA